MKMDLPIIQAPMAGGITTPELIAAVSNAGGLGSLGAGYMSAEAISTAIKNIRALTDKPFAVNLFIPEVHQATQQQINQARKAVQDCCPELALTIPTIHPPYAPDFEAQLQVLLDEKVPVFSFTFGTLSPEWVDAFKKNPTQLIGTATTLTEAKLLENCGVDAIVVQGREAGGHRGTFIGQAENALIPLSELLSECMQAIQLPLIAAGAIMNSEHVKSMMLLGAAAVQSGTAFLCCPESGSHPEVKKLLLSLDGDPTTLTRAFSGKLARGIYNKFIGRMQTYEKDILNYPIQNALTTAMRKEAAKQKNIDFMSLWAGQAAHLCKSLYAEEIVAALSRL